MRRLKSLPSTIVLVAVAWWVAGFLPWLLQWWLRHQGVSLTPLPVNFRDGAADVAGGLVGGVVAGLLAGQILPALAGVGAGITVGLVLSHFGPLAPTLPAQEMTSAGISVATIAALILSSAVGAVLGVLARRSAAALAVAVALVVAIGTDELDRVLQGWFPLLTIPGWNTWRLAGLALAVAVAWQSTRWWRPVAAAGATLVFVVLPAALIGLTTALSTLHYGLHPVINLRALAATARDAARAALFFPTRPMEIAIAIALGLLFGFLTPKLRRRSRPAAGSASATVAHADAAKNPSAPKIPS